MGPLGTSFSGRTVHPVLAIHAVSASTSVLSVGTVLAVVSVLAGSSSGTRSTLNIDDTWCLRGWVLDSLHGFTADGSVEFAGSTGLGDLLSEAELLGRFVLDLDRVDPVNGPGGDDGQAEDCQHGDSDGNGSEPVHRGGTGMAL